MIDGSENKIIDCAEFSFERCSKIIPGGWGYSPKNWVGVCRWAIKNPFPFLTQKAKLLSSIANT